MLKPVLKLSMFSPLLSLLEYSAPHLNFTYFLLISNLILPKEFYGNVLLELIGLFFLPAVIYRCASIPFNLCLLGYTKKDLLAHETVFPSDPSLFVLPTMTMDVWNHPQLCSETEVGKCYITSHKLGPLTHY